MIEGWGLRMTHNVVVISQEEARVELRALESQLQHLDDLKRREVQIRRRVSQLKWLLEEH